SVCWAGDVADSAADDGACDGSWDTASGTYARSGDGSFDCAFGAALDREINAAVSHWLDADCCVLLAQNLVDKHALSFKSWI
ncbi:hypothetical protein, partial [Aeromonas veronii]|uniref:hypothetical protein n=1 Tax=Aeromonas veronii TaxID=654 RepID=UPI003D22A961